LSTEEEYFIHELTSSQLLMLTENQAKCQHQQKQLKVVWILSFSVVLHQNLTKGL